MPGGCGLGRACSHIKASGFSPLPYQRKFYIKYLLGRHTVYMYTVHYFCQKKFFVNFASLSTLSSSVETLARYDLMETFTPMNVIIDRNTRANGINTATMGIYSFFFYVLIGVIHV